MRATRAIIRIDHFTDNVEQLRAHAAGPAGRVRKLCLAVKADAYGHGIRLIGVAAEQHGIDCLAVATVDEALELRDAGVSIPILLYSLPDPNEIPIAVSAGVTPLLCDEEMIEMFETACREAGTSITVHLKIDTGMGRIGCRPEEASRLASRIAESDLLTLGGVSTHFAASDTSDVGYTSLQVSRFSKALDEIRAAGIDPGVVHASNTGAVLAHPTSWFDMVRPGIAAYGYYPSMEQERVLSLKPVMELRSKVVFIKHVDRDEPVSYGLKWRAPQATYVGTIPVGYGDGYNRLLTNRGNVLIGDTRYPVIGAVCMDQIMVDLGPECRVDRFDNAVLFGYTPNSETAESLATKCGTIPYEITCGVSSRVPRIPVYSSAEALTV